MKLRLLLFALLGAAVIAAPAAAGKPSQSPVVDFHTGTPIAGGWSTLVRTPSGISTTFHTSGLPAGNAFTLWYVIFNNPAACSAPGCGEDDVMASQGTPTAAQVGVLRAAGHVVGSSGPASFAGSLRVGDLSDALTVPTPGGPFQVFPFGLMNPMGAEVHLVLLNHGQFIPGMPEMIHSFTACNLPLGAPGVNDFGCADWQASIHMPPAAG